MDHTEKLLLRASEVSELAGLGKSKTYELIAAGIIPSVRIGKSVRVPVGQLREWIEALPTHSQATAPRKANDGTDSKNGMTLRTAERPE